MDDPVDATRRAGRVASLLGDAATRIRSEGWIQRRFRGIDGEVCALQALMDVARSGPYALAEVAEAECRLLDAVAGRPVCASAWSDRPERIVAWNDAAGRIAADVVEVFDEAAQACAMHPEAAWSRLFSDLASRTAA